MVFYVDSETENPSGEIAYFLKKCILSHVGAWSELVFLCIGSDRMTGDCLGPYVGQQLSGLDGQEIFVYGTLEKPVHALNLAEMIQKLQKDHPRALVIAIDACLGEKRHLGYVTIADGALHPGAGVRKELPPVGDIHITGIVNVSGVLDQLTLQTTRLSSVIALANVITQGILTLLHEKTGNDNIWPENAESPLSVCEAAADSEQAALRL